MSAQRGQSWWPDKGSVQGHSFLWSFRVLSMTDSEAIYPVHIIWMELMSITSLTMQSMYVGFGGVV